MWINGKKILITGATNGLGYEMAKLFSINGANIIAHGRSAPKLELLKNEINNNRIIDTICCDLKNIDKLDVIKKSFSVHKPEVLVVNAGYNNRKVFADDINDNEVVEMLNINLLSAIMIITSFLSLPKSEEFRKLLIILSTSCHNVRKQMSLYIASKMGLMGFGKALQQEQNELNTYTTLVYPGRMNTNFRQTKNESYVSPESAARICLDLLCLPNDVIPYEFTFRPTCDINI